MASLREAMMFEQGQLRRAFLYEAVQGKLLWSLWAEMRGGHFPRVAEKFIAYMDAAVRRDMGRYAAELSTYPSDSLCMIKNGQFTADEKAAFEKVCDWLYHQDSGVLIDALATIKHKTMARLKEHRLDNAPAQQITALLNNKLLWLMKQDVFGAFDGDTFSKAFVAFRNDSNLDSGDPFDVPEDMPDIEFMERAVKFLQGIPLYTMQARFAAHIMDGCIDWCYGETEREFKSRIDEIFGEAKEYFVAAVAADSHPRWMAELLLELDDTLVNSGELDGELYDALNTAAATVQEKLAAQGNRSFMTPAEFLAREFK